MNQQHLFCSPQHPQNKVTPARVNAPIIGLGLAYNHGHLGGVPHHIRVNGRKLLQNKPCSTPHRRPRHPQILRGPSSLRWAVSNIPLSVFRTTLLFSSSARHPQRNRKLAFILVEPHLLVSIHGIWRICSPQSPAFLTRVLYIQRDHVKAGHRCQKKTFLALSKHYYWPGMKAYTNAYVESSIQCSSSKSLNQKPAGVLQQLLIPSRCWNHASLDFTTDLPTTTTGHDSILLLVD